MAASLGSLVVSLGLNAYEFTTGLERSEYRARRFAERVDREIAKGIIKAQVAIEAFAGSVRTAFDKAIVDVGNFKQISEQIGDTAEAVAALDKAAATSGVSLQEIGALSARLTATLSKTDDEGDAAAKALKAIGINFADFRALAPVAQLEAVAAALSKFEDGASKTAVAVALLGRTGAQALPFLNDLADQGGRTVQLTREQIESIDRYTKSLAALGQELATAGRILASDFINWLVRMTAEMREGIAITGSFAGALKLGFGPAVSGDIEGIAKAINEVNQRLRESKELAEQGGLSGFLLRARNAIFGDLGTDLKNQLDFLKFQQRQAALSLISESNLDARDLKARQRPALDFTLPSTKTPARGGGAASVSEAQRYLETLTKQVERTQELSATEQARIDIAKGLKGITPEIERQIFALAAQLDLTRQLKKDEEERKRQEEEASRIRERNAQLVARQTEEAQREAQSLRDNNEGLKEQIAFLVGGEQAVRNMERARLANAIALKEDTLAMLQNTEGNTALADAIRQQIAALKERAGLMDQVDVAEKFRLEVEKLQDLKNSFSDALVQPLVDFVNQTKSAKDAFRSFLNSIQQMLTQKAARGIADYLFGGNTQSGFDFSTILKLIGGLFGGGGGLGYGTIGSSIPSGPYPYANGTAFHPGGMAWVGEGGPELLRLPRGAQVIPSKQSLQMTGRQMVFNVNVLPGADTRSARQAGEALRDVVMRSIRER